MNLFNTVYIVAILLNNQGVTPTEVSLPQFDRLIEFLAKFAASAGAVWLIMEIIMFSITFSTSDQSQKVHALMRMAGSFMMLSAGSIYLLIK